MGNRYRKILDDVIQANLRRTGAFNLLPLPPQDPPLRHDLELSPGIFETWKNLGTHALVVGQIYFVTQMKIKKLCI